MGLFIALINVCSKIWQVLYNFCGLSVVTENVTRENYFGHDTLLSNIDMGH